LGLAYRFRGSVHYHQGGSMAVSRQAWCRQSWEFYVFIQRLLVEDWLPSNWGESLKPTPTVTHLLQPGHTYSNKTTPTNGATPWSKNIQTITVCMCGGVSVWCGGVFVNVCEHVFVYVFVSVGVFECVCECVCCECVSVWICESVCFVYLWVCEYVCDVCVYLCLWVYECEYVSVHVCVSVCVWCIWVCVCAVRVCFVYLWVWKYVCECVCIFVSVCVWVCEWVCNNMWVCGANKWLCECVYTCVYVGTTFFILHGTQRAQIIYHSCAESLHLFSLGLQLAGSVKGLDGSPGRRKDFHTSAR
jgi:hypothetical protein